MNCFETLPAIVQYGAYALSFLLMISAIVVVVSVVVMLGYGFYMLRHGLIMMRRRKAYRDSYHGWKR